MSRPVLLSLLASLLATAGLAHADVAPPPRASITLELSVEGQASVPHLKLFVTNCREPPEKSVLDPSEPLVCNPSRGPVRVFGFREGDLIELFEKLRNDAGRAESAAFLSAKAKTCGEVADQDLVFADTEITLVEARYAVEPRGKDSCKLRRVSAKTKTRKELQVPTPSPPPTPSARPGPSAPASPTASGNGPPARASGCGCGTAPSGRPVWGLLALAFAACARRRFSRRSAQAS